MLARAATTSPSKTSAAARAATQIIPARELSAGGEGSDIGSVYCGGPGLATVTSKASFRVKRLASTDSRLSPLSRSTQAPSA